MATDDTTRPTGTKFLHNQRRALAGEWLTHKDIYSRALSQYGENAVEPLPGAWRSGGS